MCGAVDRPTDGVWGQTDRPTGCVDRQTDRVPALPPPPALQLPQQYNDWPPSHSPKLTALSLPPEPQMPHLFFYKRGFYYLATVPPPEGATYSRCLCFNNASKPPTFRVCVSTMP